MHKQSERARVAKRRFLHAYEQTFGNISASCRYAGISRKTFYRWMKGDTPANRRFKRMVEQTMPEERRQDILMSKLMELVEAGNTRAIIFALKYFGQDRGYS